MSSDNRDFPSFLHNLFLRLHFVLLPSAAQGLFIRSCPLPFVGSEAGLSVPLIWYFLKCLLLSLQAFLWTPLFPDPLQGMDLRGSRTTPQITPLRSRVREESLWAPLLPFFPLEEIMETWQISLSSRARVGCVPQPEDMRYLLNLCPTILPFGPFRDRSMGSAPPPSE